MALLEIASHQLWLQMLAGNRPGGVCVGVGVRAPPHTSRNASSCKEQKTLMLLA